MAQGPRVSVVIPPLKEKLNSLSSGLRPRAGSLLGRIGYSHLALRQVQRDGVEWAYARYSAARNRRGLLRGWAIVLATEGGQAELVPAEVPRAGRGQVTVRVNVSVVSPGTERAQYLRLPNAQVGRLGRLGYSASGVVIATGPDVRHFGVGDAVAVMGAAHASVVTVDAPAAVPIPDGVGFEVASLVMLGVICGQGVAWAGLSADDRFCVIGAGPIGVLTQRLAAAAGGRCDAVAATSSRGQQLAAAAGGRFLVVEADSDEIAAIGSPVVFEATGSPEAIAVAVRAAGEHGRIVLLGSPRGVTTHFPLDEIRAKRVRLVGAHVNTLEMESAGTGATSPRREALRFLDLVRNGGVTVDDLAGPSIDPREAGLFYCRLATDRNLVGAHFDWTRLPAEERLSHGRLWRMPDLRARGIGIERVPLPAGHGPSRPASPQELGDLFEGAMGNLRIGLLGCGDIALSNAAAAVAAPNTTLVACFDPAAELARDLASRFGAKVAPTAEALIQRRDVDAVFLAVPHHLHAPLAVEAAAAGRHVIVEKPLANNLAGALEVAAAAERAGVALTVCFPHRYAANAVLARRLVRSGALGDFGGALVKHFLDKAPSYWIGGYSGRSMSTWRSSRELAGGGMLIMNLSHHIDLLRHIAGVDVESVTGVTTAVDGVGDVEDSVSLGIRFTNGAIGSIVGSSAVRATEMVELRVWGRDGHIAVEPRLRVYTRRGVEGLRPGRWQSFGRLPRTDMRAVFLSRFATAIHQGREPDIGAGDGIAVQAFIEAAYRAADLGGSVRPAELIREPRLAEAG